MYCQFLLGAISCCTLYLSLPKEGKKRMPFPSGLGQSIFNKMNCRKLLLVLLIPLSFGSVFAQQDGYWDKERATSKQIVVSARNRMVIKTEDLPIGTTELVFRITLLDENQQLANTPEQTDHQQRQTETQEIFLLYPPNQKSGNKNQSLTEHRLHHFRVLS